MSLLEQDRVALTHRPPQRCIMRQSWFDLLFLHWKVPSQALTPLLPRGLTLDTYQGDAYIGLVPFTMKGVRPLFMPSFPPLTDFHETNVRTYVLHEGRNPGVWFFSLDAANSLAARVARAWFKLPYHYATMRLQAQETQQGREIEYATQRIWDAPKGAGCRVGYRAYGEPKSAQPGTLEHFLAERYLLYAHRQETLYRGRVYHTPYPLQNVQLAFWQENLLSAAGIEHGDEPPLAHYARGVHVDVFPLERIWSAAHKGKT